MLTGSVIVLALLAVAALAVTFFVARRAVRLFVRLALLFAFLLVLLGAYAWYRLQSRDDAPPTRNQRRITAPARR